MTNKTEASSPLDHAPVVHFQVFPTPSGSVRGIGHVNVTTGKGKAHTLAKLTLLVDDFDKLGVSFPSNVSLDEAEAYAKALLAMVAEARKHGAR